VKNRFLNLHFKCNLQRYTAAAAAAREDASDPGAVEFVPAVSAEERERR
jgi:hypothetical protein